MFKKTHRSRQQLLRAGLIGCAAACAVPALAVGIDTGNPDLTLRWDNSVRLNLGLRTEKQDPRILANPTYDESDGKFSRGDFVNKRLDLLSELDLNYKNSFGARISAAAWYDAAYRDTTVRSLVPGFATSYFNDEYNKSVKRYTRGPSGEILDAFVWANFRVADKPANLKFGRLTNYWGETYVLGAHAVSYAQSPVDGVKAVASPGIELKEVFLPLGQLYLKYQPTPSLSLAAQYFTEWKPSRLPYGGTYFGPADIFFEGPDRLPVDANTAMNASVPGILADCGGACACGTCHTFVEGEWAARLEPASSTEPDMVECAIDVLPRSRLTCQILITHDRDGLVIRLPRSQV